MQTFSDCVGVVAVGKNIGDLEVHALGLHYVHEVLDDPCLSSAVLTNKTTAALSGYSASSLQEFQYIVGDKLGEEGDRSSNDDNIVIERNFLAHLEIHVESLHGVPVRGNTVGKPVRKFPELGFIGFVTTKQNTDSHYPVIPYLDKSAAL